MFDVGWQELLLIAVVALIVIGPKDLPAAMRTVARALSKIRGLSREFQQGVSEIMREAELDEIRRKVDQAGRVDVTGEMGGMLDPDGRLRSDFDLTADLRPTFPGDGRAAGSGGDDDGDRADRPPAATAPQSAFASTSPETPPAVTPSSQGEVPPLAPASPSPPPSPSEPLSGSGKA